ncbi:MAG TPA: glutamate 5-kinase [Chloroflexi bacterium]|jgi:glutamate 5-kinase|nr:glutamate 5-kinase [Chloroflexota bacterium]
MAHRPLPPGSQAWRRIVVKVGTSTLTAGTDALNPPRMLDLVRQLAALRASGLDVVLVSSGAQQAGRERLGFPQESKTIPFKQMLAAVGQGRIMHLWEQYFELYDVIVAQVLLTRQDVEDRHRYLTVRDTFEGLLQHGIVPIVNENDAVATDEIKVGENDSLSAMVANVIEADLLVLLTDTDGLYTADPHVDADAHLLECVEHIDAGVYGLATGSRSGLGTGGMYTKIVAAEMAMRSGTSVVIASGNRENALAGALERTVPATWFPARITPDEGRKRWMLAQAHTAGSVWVDDGACQAVVHGGKSLLPVGIVEVQGTFERGALVSVRDSSGREVARGLGNYDSADLRRILGQRSCDIADILGFDYGPEFLHRDKMVLL